MIKRYSEAQLMGMTQTFTKADAFKALDQEHITFDFAVPQPWLDEFVKKSGLEYRLVLATTVWAYGPLSPIFGYPTSCCTEVQRKLEDIYPWCREVPVY